MPRYHPLTTSSEPCSANLFFYALNEEHNLTTVEQFHAYASKEADAGRGALAEYVTRNGKKVEEVIANALQVVDAPRRLVASQMSLYEMLQAAAKDKPCLCASRWVRGVKGASLLRL